MDTVDAWIEHGWLIVDGKTTAEPFEMRFVRTSELDELFQLHQTIVATIEHPHVFRPDSRDFMEKHINGRGRTVGVFVEGHMVAYAAVSFPDGDPDNLARDLPLPPEAFSHVADYDGSAVQPPYRGNRLQQQMTEMRHRYALAHDRYHILGTVWPLNVVSLANFLAIGCRVKNIKQKYGGMTRLIIHRDLRVNRPTGFDPNSLCDVSLNDTALLTELLRRGFHGFQVVTGHGSPNLRMGLPAAQIVADGDKPFESAA